MTENERTSVNGSVSITAVGSKKYKEAELTLKLEEGKKIVGLNMENQLMIQPNYI